MTELCGWIKFTMNSGRESLAMRVYVMVWEEKEAGWGVRSDGWSVHVSPGEYEDHLRRHWALTDELFERRRARTRNPTPWEYSQPVPDVVLREIELPDDHPLARRLAIEKSVCLNQKDNAGHELERLIGGPG